MNHPIKKKPTPPAPTPNIAQSEPPIVEVVEKPAEAVAQSVIKVLVLEQHPSGRVTLRYGSPKPYLPDVDMLAKNISAASALGVIMDKLSTLPSRTKLP